MEKTAVAVQAVPADIFSENPAILRTLWVKNSLGPPLAEIIIALKHMHVLCWFWQAQSQL